MNQDFFSHSDDCEQVYWLEWVAYQIKILIICIPFGKVHRKNRQIKINIRRILFQLRISLVIQDYGENKRKQQIRSLGLEINSSFLNLWLVNESICHYLFVIKGIIQVGTKSNYFFWRQFYQFIFSKPIMIKTV